MSSKLVTTVTVEKLEESDLSQELLRQNLNDSVIERAMRPNLRKRAQRPRIEYTCEICDEEFPDRSKYSSHIKTHSGEFKCNICNSKFKRKKYMQRHIINYHTEKRYKYECKICKMSFPYNNKLLKHMRVHTGEKPYKCDVCGKSFSAQYSLKTHMLLHTDAKPFACSSCLYRCRDSSTLRKHEHRHAGLVTLYECRKCDITYKTMSRLKLHVSEEHLGMDMRKYECEICKKRFKCITNKRVHYRNVHERSNEGNCDICGQYLPNVGNMAAHLRMHTEERNVKCSYEPCAKSFKSLTDMKRHAIIHDPTKHHRCDRCPQTFSRRHRLNLHVQRRHMRRQIFECDVCDTRYYNRGSLTRHTNTVHEGARYRCDHCSFYTNMKQGLVLHLRKKHSLQDRTCKICSKEYKNVEFLKIHMMQTHPSKQDELNLINKKQDENVKIKEEAIDIEEHDLEEALRDAEVVNGEDISIPALHGVISEDVTHQSELEDDHNPVEIIDNTPKIPEGSNIDETSKVIAKPKRPIKRTHKYLEHKQKCKINDKPKQSATDKNNTLQEAKDMLERVRKEYNDTLRQRAERKRLEQESKISEKQSRKIILYKAGHKNTKANDLTTENNKSINKDNNMDNEEKNLDKGDQKLDNEDYKLDSKKSKLEISSEKNDDGKNAKIIFKTAQCYVCFKLFENRDKLIEHCQEHFDICNKKLLKKCPFCAYVTSGLLTRHISLVHKVKIKASYNTLIKKDDHSFVVDIKEKKMEGQGSNIDNVNQVHIIPSIGNLNRQEYIKIDRKNREEKCKKLVTSKLVKKGDEWSVELETLNLNYEDFYLNELDERSVKNIVVNIEDDYIEKLIKLKLAVKKNGQKMLCPCDLCEKVCTNMAALKAHRKSHVKQARVRRKNKNDISKTMNGNENLLEFYKSNIGGSDIEFEQFVKIFTEINKVGDDNMDVLVNHKKYGLDLDGNVKRGRLGRSLKRRKVHDS